jgi:hypothetical protein
MVCHDRTGTWGTTVLNIQVNPSKTDEIRQIHKETDTSIDTKSSTTHTLMRKGRKGNGRVMICTKLRGETHATTEPDH